MKSLWIRYIVKGTYLISEVLDMEPIMEKKNPPVKPYDDSMWDYQSMYDKMPYVRDSDLNVEQVFSRVSGNIIKSYRCQIKEPYELKH